MTNLKQKQTEEAIRRLETFAKSYPEVEEFTEAIEHLKNGDVLIITDRDPMAIPTRDFERVAIRKFESSYNAKVYMVIQDENPQFVTSTYVYIESDPTSWPTEREEKLLSIYTFCWTRANIAWAFRAMADEIEKKNPK